MTHAAIVVIFFIAVAGVIIYIRKMEKQRTEALAVVAKQLGGKFQKNPDENFQKSFDQFQLFSKGSSKKIKNIISFNNLNNTCDIFGYTFTTGTGKNRSISTQTVASFSGRELDFPDFDLCPQNILHNIGKVFGYQDIDFESSPEFSDKYLLRGKNEKNIRSLFNQRLLKYFEKNDSHYVEARANRVIIYKPYQRVKPEEIKNFYNQSQKVYQQLCEASGV